MYARAFLEGRLDEAQLDNFRMEVGGNGLSSYPHPRLMPDFWEYPTVSMGLGPINSIYHARFNRYMHDRKLDDTSGSKIWSFLGDGETDEPETLGAISLAGRSQLDNLIWVVNCNLQRLDGPVRGNGKIIQELEGVFRGAGWNVIKVIWGSRWDELLQRDVDGVLLNQMNNTIDGEYQRYATESGGYIREHFFGPDPRLRKLVEHLSDDDLKSLPRGGHDYQKMYAAFKAASENEGSPTVILAKTVKGWTLGEGFEGRNSTHQIKKMTSEQLLDLRERLHLEDVIPENRSATRRPFRTTGRRTTRPRCSTCSSVVRALDGPLPERKIRPRRPMTLPGESVFTALDKGSNGREVSTTMVFTSMLRDLLRDDKFGDRIVPIVPDEARTFGMDALFREFKIYAPTGQLYEPVDHDLLLSYAEGKDGQILEEGITEAGSMASWIAAATSYANLGVPMVPFFTFYSMFGFQRVGDLIWSAADSRARGFLMGATAGRTTLMGEGLQHQDGHSLLLASTVPACQAYDPAVRLRARLPSSRDGMQRMYPESGPATARTSSTTSRSTTRTTRCRLVPTMYDDEDITSGLYKWHDGPDGDFAHRATILFSGPAHTRGPPGPGRAGRTLRRGRRAVERDLLQAAPRGGARASRAQTVSIPDEPEQTPPVTAKLADSQGPVVAVSDFMTAVPDQIARWVPRTYLSLGTDGYGRSDTREALRTFFEVDMPHVVIAVLTGLVDDGAVERSVVSEAIELYGVDADRIDPYLHDNHAG